MNRKETSAGVGADGKSGAGPLAIRKFSQRYDAAEDRIAIDVQGPGSRALRMWLTRRLGDALFGHLGRELTARDAARDPEFARHMQVWEQQAAQAQLRGGDPVSRQWEAVLLSAIDMETAPKGVTVIFKASLAGVSHPVAKVSLNETRLRQWLGIMFRLYRTAGWPTSGWPDWLVDAQQVGVSATDPADSDTQ